MNVNTDRRGISPVVGVILMVAITVILAAIIGVFVLDLGGSTSSSPSAGINVDEYQKHGVVSVQMVTAGTVDEIRIESGEHTDALTTVGDTVTLPAAETVTVVGIADGEETVLQVYNPDQTTIDNSQFAIAPDNLAEIHDAMDGDGSSSTPYKITNIHELQSVNHNPTGGNVYVLTGDIEAHFTKYWNDGDGFSPIGGDEDTAFTGTLDGQGEKIYNLNIDRSSEHYTGLFGSIESGGKLTDVGIVDSTIVGNGNVGQATGSNFGTISNVYATGSVTGTDWAGGLVGVNRSGGTISNSYTTGSITSSSVGDSTDHARIGGLVGVNRDGATITNVYSHTTVTVESDGEQIRVGGLVGNNGGDLTKAYSTGDVTFTGDGDETYVGGLSGNTWAVSHIDNTYTSSTVSVDSTGGDVQTGGLIGRHSGEVTNSNWDTAATGYDTSAGAETDESYYGLTMDDMTGGDATLTMSLDFTSTWNTTNQYPELNWE